MFPPEAVQAIDESIMRVAHATPLPVGYVFWALTTIGGGYGLLLTLPFLLRRSTRMTAAALLAVELAQSGAVQAIKSVVARPRPCDALGWCSAVIVSSPGGYSFPSGHAAGTFCFVVFVSIVRPKLAPYLVPIAVAIAWSRCVLGVHYPSDIAAGALLGGAFGYAGARLAMRFFPEAKPADAPPPPAVDEA